MGSHTGKKERSICEICEKKCEQLQEKLKALLQEKAEFEIERTRLHKRIEDIERMLELPQGAAEIAPIPEGGPQSITG